jgi:hypothetical protein
VTKHDGLTIAPILVIDLRAVFGFDCAHLSLLEFRNSEFFSLHDLSFVNSTSFSDSKR